MINYLDILKRLLFINSKSESPNKDIDERTKKIQQETAFFTIMSFRLKTKKLQMLELTKNENRYSQSEKETIRKEFLELIEELQHEINKPT